MTILGKLLTILVFVLALAWTWFTVEIYVTQTNWQKEAQRSQKKAEEATLAANQMKELLIEQQAAAADANRATQAERDRLYQQVATLAKERDALARDYVAAFGATQAGNVAVKNLETNLKTVQNQIDDLDKAIKAKNAEIDTLVKTTGNADVAAKDARREADAYKVQIERLSGQLTDLKQLYDELRRNPLGQGGLLGKTPSLPSGFRGNVTSLSRDGSGYTVTFTPGSDAGVLKGAKMSVSREAGVTGKYLGTLTVILVDPKGGVGLFTPANPRGVPAADDLPKAGDLVKPN